MNTNDRGTTTTTTTTTTNKGTFTHLGISVDTYTHTHTHTQLSPLTLKGELPHPEVDLPPPRSENGGGSENLPGFESGPGFESNPRHRDKGIDELDTLLGYFIQNGDM